MCFLFGRWQIWKRGSLRLNYLWGCSSPLLHTCNTLVRAFWRFLVRCLVGGQGQEGDLKSWLQQGRGKEMREHSLEPSGHWCWKSILYFSLGVCMSSFVLLPFGPEIPLDLLHAVCRLMELPSVSELTLGVDLRASLHFANTIVRDMSRPWKPAAKPCFTCRLRKCGRKRWENKTKI